MKTFIFLTTFLCSLQALALNWVSDVQLAPASQSYSGPANSIMPGKTIGAYWNAITDIQEVFWCGAVFHCNRSTMEPFPTAVSAGMNVLVDGYSFHIFETGIPGIGYIIAAKDSATSTYLPLRNGITDTYPPYGSNATTEKLGWSAKVTFVRTGQPLESGVYTIPTINAVRLTAYNNEVKTAKVVINPSIITITSTGCVVMTKSASVNLGAVDIRQLPTVGSMSAAGTFNVTLDCDANVSLNAVLSDQTNPANDTTAISLTQDSTAGSLGVAFYYNGTGPIPLGRDSSTAGSANQFHTITTTSAQSVTLPFEARYVRMGDIVPGTANALASLTFSYQ